MERAKFIRIATFGNRLITLSLIAFMLLAGCTPAPNAPQTTNSLKILAFAPKTGSASYLGDPIAWSMALAADDINNGGGLMGQPLELIRIDSHSDPDSAIAEAEFFYRREPERVIGIAGTVLDSESLQVLKKIAYDPVRSFGKPVIMVSPASSSLEFIKGVDPEQLFFRTVPNSLQGMKPLAQKARKLGFSRAAVITFGDEMGNELGERFKELFADKTRSATVSYYYEHSPPEIAKAVQQAALMQPDVVVLSAYGDDAKIILREWSISMPAAALMLPDTLMSDRFFSLLAPLVREALDRAVINGISPGVSPAENPEYKDLSKRFCGIFRDRCGCQNDEDGCMNEGALRAPAYVANAYDAVFIIALALQKAWQENPKSTVPGGSWDISSISNNVRRVVNQDSSQDVPIGPGEWKQAKELLAAGQDIDYHAASASDLELDLNGDPIKTHYLFWTVRKGHIVLTNSEGEEEYYSD